LGQQAVTIGLENLDLVRIHERALSGLMPRRESSAARNRFTRRAGMFFSEANKPLQKAHRAGSASAVGPDPKSKALDRRTTQLAATNRDLKQGITRRKAAEKALRKSGRRRAKLLRESNRLQKQLSHLTRHLLFAQEAARAKMSHELRDGVAQTLLGINVRLLTLKDAATSSPAVLTKEIASTQRVVEESVRSIKRFAHELEIRPERDCD
jgi:signal transduction histidine kinase